jgi:hypothetical protein
MDILHRKHYNLITCFTMYNNNLNFHCYKNLKSKENNDTFLQQI